MKFPCHRSATACCQARVTGLCVAGRQRLLLARSRPERVDLWMLLGTCATRGARARRRSADLGDNFRRAWKTAMLTGMRALDLQGRITYVNPAFCQMTAGVRRAVGRTRPSPTGPTEDREMLAPGSTTSCTPLHTGRFEVRVKRKAARFSTPHVCLATDRTATASRRVDVTRDRHQRTQAHRTAVGVVRTLYHVLEGLDAAVSVVALGSEDCCLPTSSTAPVRREVAGQMSLIAQAGVRT